MPVRTMRRMIPFMFLCLAAGCASRGDVESVQRDSYDLRNRVAKLEKDMGGIRQETRDELQTTVKNLRKGAADLQATQDTIRVDIQELSGKLDDLKLQVQKPAEEKAFQREEAERRLAALEDRMLKLEKKLGATADSKGAPAAETPESIYENGLTLFRSGDMQKSRDAFTLFTEKYPRHELKANALFWIGESYYGEKKYEQAVLAYQEVIKNYPKKDKAPGAMLKQAMSFKALGDKKNARYVLKELQEAYPRSGEAKKAQQLLKTL